MVVVVLFFPLNRRRNRRSLGGGGGLRCAVLSWPTSSATLRFRGRRCFSGDSLGIKCGGSAIGEAVSDRGIGGGGDGGGGRGRRRRRESGGRGLLLLWRVRRVLMWVVVRG